MKATALIISCEHGGNIVPPAYEHIFKGAEVLNTHRGQDFGALEIANFISTTMQCHCNTTNVTRLLIDCNRSLTHPKCFSEFTKPLPKHIKEQIIADYYLPYRKKTEQIIEHYIAQQQQVLHISVHSFTPTLLGVTRQADIGLLYDPKRHGEKEVARSWRTFLLQQEPIYNIRMNYPYRGNTDGFVFAMRKKYPEEEYLGIELESNQALIAGSIVQLQEVLAHSLQELLQFL